MSDYVGQPPHGGYKITHHELCLGDCGHWDCMGCCGCPPDDIDVELVATLTSDEWPREWIADWFSEQIAKASTKKYDENEMDAAIEKYHKTGYAQGLVDGAVEGVKTGRSGALADAVEEISQQAALWKNDSLVLLGLGVAIEAVTRLANGTR